MIHIKALIIFLILVGIVASGVAALSGVMWAIWLWKGIGALVVLAFLVGVSYEIARDLL